MYEIALMIFVLIAIALIVLVLMQHGKGADIGAAFGSGASSTVFGSAGSSGFLLKLTGGLAAVFMALALLLGHMVMTQAKADKRFIIPTTSKQQSKVKQTSKPVSQPVKKPKN